MRHEGRIVAFANIWATGDKRELSVDLDAPCRGGAVGTMDFLFARLMLGTRTGLCALSVGWPRFPGIDARRLSPIWAKAAAVLFRHGERLYGFQGLRATRRNSRPNGSRATFAGPRGMGLDHRAPATLNALRQSGRDRRAVAAQRPVAAGCAGELGCPLMRR